MRCSITAYLAHPSIHTIFFSNRLRMSPTIPFLITSRFFNFLFLVILSKTHWKSYRHDLDTLHFTLIYLKILRMRERSFYFFIIVKAFAILYSCSKLFSFQTRFPFTKPPIFLLSLESIHNSLQSFFFSHLNFDARTKKYKSK